MLDGSAGHPTSWSKSWRREKLLVPQVPWEWFAGVLLGRVNQAAINKKVSTLETSWNPVSGTPHQIISIPTSGVFAPNVYSNKFQPCGYPWSSCWNPSIIEECATLGATVKLKPTGSLKANLHFHIAKCALHINCRARFRCVVRMVSGRGCHIRVQLEVIESQRASRESTAAFTSCMSNGWDHGKPMNLGLVKHKKHRVPSSYHLEDFPFSQLQPPKQYISIYL